MTMTKFLILFFPEILFNLNSYAMENVFQGITNAIELMKRYKQFAMLYHPVKGGSVDKMKQVYEDYLAVLKSEPFQLSRMKEDMQKDLNGFPGLIKELIILELDLEMIGSWLWISGCTFEHKEKLKELGLHYSLNKRCWYFRPGSEESHTNKLMDMAWIRGKYGTDITQPNSTKTLQGEEATV
jgi:hypothetical protein